VRLCERARVIMNVYTNKFEKQIMLETNEKRKTKLEDFRRIYVRTLCTCRLT
jgi:hypothetical protein